MNVAGIFDAFMKASDIVALRDQALRKQEQIDSVRSRLCGNCAHWMKTTCAPEKVHGQFKSMASPACAAFAQCVSSRDLEDKFRGELERINGRIATTLTQTR